jgi:hypothetical protein
MTEPLPADEIERATAELNPVVATIIQTLWQDYLTRTAHRAETQAIEPRHVRRQDLPVMPFATNNMVDPGRINKPDRL